jgi:hypothetical protein
MIDELFPNATSPATLDLTNEIDAGIIAWICATEEIC